MAVGARVRLGRRARLPPAKRPRAHRGRGARAVGALGPAPPPPIAAGLSTGVFGWDGRLVLVAGGIGEALPLVCRCGGTKAAVEAPGGSWNKTEERGRVEPLRLAIRGKAPGLPCLALAGAPIVAWRLVSKVRRRRFAFRY